MKGCIDKIDEDHSRGNVKPRTPSPGGSPDRPTGSWGNFFACCGNSIDESTLDHPPRLHHTLHGEDVDVVTEDESESVSSACSLDDILDQVATPADKCTPILESPISCASEDAMLLETAKRDTVSGNDSFRSSKRWRGPVRVRSFGDASKSGGSGGFGTPPPLSPRKSSPRDSNSGAGITEGEERWRGQFKLETGGGLEQLVERRSRSRSNGPLSPRASSTEKYTSRSKSRSGSCELGSHGLPPSPLPSTPGNSSHTHPRRRSRSGSRSGSYDLSHGLPPSAQHPSSTLDEDITRRRSRSSSRSRSYDLGNVNPPSSPHPSSTSVITRRSRTFSGSLQNDAPDKYSLLPPPSPSSSTTTNKQTPPPPPETNLSGLDMLIELQKDEAEIEKKLTEDDKINNRTPRQHHNRRERQVGRKSLKRRTTKGIVSSARKLNGDEAKATTTITKSKLKFASDRSLFSFPGDVQPPGVRTNVSDTIPEIKRYIYGPRCGSFENVMVDGETDLYGDEVTNTYSTYRMDPEVARKVMGRMAFSLPMYHAVPSSLSTRGVKNVCSEPVATDFLVRGPTYMEDSEKVVSREAVFSILGANNILNRKVEEVSHSFRGPDDFVKRFRQTCKQEGVQTPFILIVKFTVPWGTFTSYYYRPNGTNGGAFAESESEQPSEKLWRAFMAGSDEFRNSKLKLIPSIVVGPWVLKKMVGAKPGMVGQKLPITYTGSNKEGYFEINMDITRGGKVANSICAACANKASLIAVDLAFLLQGDSAHELPEQLLAVVRLHHIQLKKGSFL